MFDAGPLYPQKRTSVERVEMSALCQERTFRKSFYHLVDARLYCRRHVEAERLRFGRPCNTATDERHTTGTDQHPKDRNRVQPLTEKKVS